MSENLIPLSVKAVIEQEGEYVSTTCGSSMRPMLRDRRDTVIIRKKDGKANKYDVVLYRTEDGYILHRVIKVLPESYVICGDNRTVLEKGIRDEDIIGVLSAVYRGERQIRLEGIGYSFYCRYIVYTFYPRKLFRRFKSILSKIKKKIFGKSRG